MTADDPTKTATSDGTLVDTEAALAYIDAKNEDGWVLTVGTVGGSYNWASAPTVGFGRSVTVQGADPTTLTTINTSSTGFGIILTCTSSKLITLKNFNFPDYASANAMLLVNGTGTDAFRVTNITADASNHGGGAKFLAYVHTAASGVTTEGPYGLFRNITITSSGGICGFFIRDGDSVASWDRPMPWGTNKAVFIEDCTLTSNSLVQGSPFLDSNNGGRAVWRYNTMLRGSVANHGADTSGTVNSALQVEVYNNTFTIGDGEAMDRLMSNRGGSGLYFDNIINRETGVGEANTMLKLQYHRAGPLGDGQGGVVQDRFHSALSTTIAAGSDGAALPQAIINVADTSALLADFASGASFVIKVTTSAGVQDVTCTGKTGTSFTGCTGGTGTMSTGGAVTRASDYVGTQQPGAGHTVGVNGDPQNPAKEWGSQPMYIWGNSVSVPLQFGLVSNETYGFMQLNRDYFLSAKPGYSPYTYPHPLGDVPNEAPALVTAPVETATEEVGGVWDTDEGVVSGSPVPTLTVTIHECSTP